MNALTFDTLKAARRLRDEFGFDERQAQGIVETFADGLNVSFDDLATKHDLDLVRRDLEQVRKDLDAFRKELKGDIDALRKALKGDIDALRNELKGDIDALRAETKGGMRELEHRMTIKLGAMIVAAGGFFTLLDRLLG